MNVCLLDVGQTGVRLRSDDGNASTDFEYPGITTDTPIAPQIAELLIEHAARVDEQWSSITIATTALGEPVATLQELAALLRPLDVRELAIAHDSIAGFLGAVGDQFGAVAISGTGVVTLGLSEHLLARVDGWGNIIGDAGSGYWIGREAFDMAMRAHDGRGNPTALLDLIGSHFPDIERAYLDLQGDPNRVARVASFAKDVITLAPRDDVARRIVDRACQELALSVTAALSRVGFTLTDAPTVSWAGKIARNPTVSEGIAVNVMSTWPQAHVIHPSGEPIDGVAFMRTLPPSHPMSTAIHRCFL